MAENDGGNPVAETVSQTTAPNPDNQSTEPTQAPDTSIPERFRGKRPEELVNILMDKEREVGRLGSELGDLRQRTQTYEQTFAQWQMQQAAQQAQTAQPYQGQPDESAKFDWENPERAVDARVERKLRTEYEQLRRQVMMETATSQAPIAKNIAKNMYPDAFKGVTDEELDRAMFGGAAAGNVQPQNLTKPEAWRMLGWIIQGEKTGYRMAPPPVNPVSPSATETPMGARPQTFGGEQNIAVDDEARSILKGFGMDEGEYLKNRRTERGSR